VIVASAGAEGDTQKDLVLTEARAMVVREYFVENFGFDDSQVKTLGLGKHAEANSGDGWGTVQILIYPEGARTPPKKPAQAASLSKTTSDQPEETSASAMPKPQ